jgi:hypothetical protein
MSVNMDGILVVTRAVWRHMQARGGGSIVNQSSTAAYLHSGPLRPRQDRRQQADGAAGRRDHRRRPRRQARDRDFEDFLGCPTPVDRGRQDFVVRAAPHRLERWPR